MVRPTPKREIERDTSTFAKGGRTKMHKPQAANQQKPARTGHVVEGKAPGPRSAKGGPRNEGFGLSSAAAPLMAMQRSKRLSPP
jgi:hypothetical protein